MNAFLALMLAIFGLSAGGAANPQPPTSPPAVVTPGVARPLGAGDALQVAVRGDDRVITTADGRQVFLRGANVNGLIDYGGVGQTVPVTAQDGVQMRALGFNVVRLAVSWSKIAPAAGQISQSYLDDIRTAAKVFADQGIYVLLDVHQDRYAAGLGPSGDESDGAPAWAALTGGASTAANSGGHPYYGTAASKAAATAFFDNQSVGGTTLQDYYAQALEAVAGVGQSLGPAFAGIELWNEPVDPRQASYTAPDTFSAPKLWPFYNRMIGALRGDGYSGPIWFEPQANRTNTDSDAAAAQFSGDPNLVYGPHIYTDVYNGQLGTATIGRLATSFDNAASEARKYHAALAPTELPGASGGAWETYRQYDLLNLDRLGIGGMVWVWKQHSSSSYGWGVLNGDGSVRTDSNIAADYGRARVLASGSQVVSQAYDTSANVLTVQTNGAGTVDLWDGVINGPSAPTVGRSPKVTVDGTAVSGSALQVWNSATTFGTTWAGGRQLRLTVGAGSHTIRLSP